MPARNEAERIGACLEALLGQRDLLGVPLPAGSIKILVFANNCQDRTADVARQAHGAIRVVEGGLSCTQPNAGAARRAAMDAAAALLPAGGAGLICTTDADSRPRPDWIARLWKAVESGAHAVAGAVDFDPCELGALVITDARRRESVYAALQAEIIACADPEAHNPWPNHIWAWGANLAVTETAYRRVGGLQPLPLAEDRAFVDRLRLHDMRVRHCLDARVWTSARRIGRAPGGLASLVDDHAGLDRAACDAVLEPAWAAWRRALWRRRLRSAYAEGVAPGAISTRLRVAAPVLQAAMQRQTFGAAWRLIEGASPVLRPQRLTPLELPVEIARAERLLRRLMPAGPADPADRIRAASAGLWSMSATP